MDISATQQVSPQLSAQRTAQAQEAITVKMANDQIEAEGQAALALIQSATVQPNDRVGSILNVAV